MLRPLTSVAYIRGSVDYGRFGLLTDNSYVSLKSAEGTLVDIKTRSIDGPRGRRSLILTPDGQRQLDARIGNIQGIYDLALQSQGPNRTLSFRGPSREASRTLEGFNLQRQQSFGGTVAQPLIGTQAMVIFSPRLRLFARADLGGFGMNNSEDCSWNAQAGVGYAIGDSTQLNLSWRYLHLGGSHAQIPENTYNIDQNGIEAGVKFFF